ncbi:MATE family efflux transporter [Actinoplanes sp. TFC3]|uniref:MATE family efflux transporter n=1 Tax=Actinoplanes sp. TFC3 TaxID=1710355 RepID=UPI0009E8FE68|nr:MATE family efflux transporter [Actinoplanes sp. TFC3]
MSDMTTGPVLRHILRFSLPLTAANLLQQGYLLVDSIAVGRYVGITGLAAVGACAPLFYLLNAMFIGLGTAFTIRLAHLQGARQGGERRGVVLALALLTAGWAAGCIILATVLAGPVLGLMGIHGQLAEDCRLFFGVLSIGFPGMFGGAAVSAYFRGLGDSRAAMWVQGLSSVANIVLVWAFLALFGFGIAGAAMATVVASTLGLLGGLAYARRRHPVPPGAATPAVRRELIDAVRLGFPLASQHIILALGILVLVWIIQFYGETVMATFTIVSRIESFASLLFLDFSGAVTAFVAQNLGTGDEPRARLGLLRTLGLTAGLAVLTSAVVLLARTPIAALFTTDPATHRLTEHYLLIIFPFFVLYTVMVVLHGYLNGARRTVAPLVCTIIAFVAVQIPFAWLLNGPFGIDAVMWAVVASWTAGLTYSIFCLRHVLFARPVSALTRTGTLL